MEELIFALLMIVLQKLPQHTRNAISLIRIWMMLMNGLPSNYFNNFIKHQCCVRIIANGGDIRYSFNVNDIFLREISFTHTPGDTPHLSSGLIPYAYRRAIDVANDEQNLIVYGATGIGKSSFLKLLFLECFLRELGQYEHTLIPVFVRGSLLISPDICLFDLIQNEFLTANFPYPRQLTSVALTRGKLLILIDDIDKIPESNRSQALNQINDFTRRYPNNRYVISCRIQNRGIYDQHFQHFTEKELTHWDDRQMRQFIDNWFRVHNYPVSIADNLWQLLQETTNSEVHRLATIPLYLTWICIRYIPLLSTDKNFLDNLEFPILESF